MERITSRKNNLVRHLRALGSDGDYRRDCGETVLDGEKLLTEAISAGAEITALMVAEDAKEKAPEFVPEKRVYCAPRDIITYVSPVANSPGPVFSLKLPSIELSAEPERVIVLENVQDPGNVGTVIRTANALGIDAVLLCGECADLFSPRVLRATMGAAFRQYCAIVSLPELKELLSSWGLQLYGAALSSDALDIRRLPTRRCAIAIGNEGHGLSAEFCGECDALVKIPMREGSESLNAAMAATIAMWELSRASLEG